MITIVNSGSDTFISDGSQAPTWNKNFIAGLSKATATNNPITGGLDSVIVLDNTGRTMVFAYSEISTINGSTPAALSLLDATDVATYLNNNFFDFGNGINSVNTASPITGDGVGVPVTLADGTKSGQIYIWNGSGWVLVDAPSYNILIRRSAKTFTYEGGFLPAPNTTYMFGNTLKRNSVGNVTMLTPGEVGRRPIVQLVGAAGVWLKLWTDAIAGQRFPISELNTEEYYFRATIKTPTGAGAGSFRIGFIDAPGTTILDGFGAEIVAGGIRAFCNSGASYTYGTTATFTNAAWYDVECLYEYTGGNMVCKVFVNGILVSTATRAVASFSGNCSVAIINAGGAAGAIIHTDLMEFSID